MCDADEPAPPGPHPVSGATIAMADGFALPALTCAPPAAVATVVVVPDLFGLSHTTVAVQQRLASVGLASVAVGYHHRVGPDTPEDEEAARERRRAMDETAALADLSTTVDVVRARDGVSRGARVPLIGFCMGGTMALVLAARRRDLAVVSCYGFPRSSRMPAVACPRPLDLVPEMAGPVLGLWGDADRSVPLDDVRALETAFVEHGVDATVEVRRGVGHGFLTARDETSQEAAAVVWPRITTFLTTHGVPTP